MAKLLALAVPISKGKEADFKKFLDELNSRWAGDFTESRKQLNVRERTFHQKTPDGELVVVTLEGENPEEAIKQFAQGNDDFTRWFVQSVKEIHNIDLTAMDQVPLPELVLDTMEMQKVKA
jgi:hypothetical protein